ncbi:MAG: helix-turn-helix domain-containing protein [Patescibacteria group bacterium]
MEKNHVLLKQQAVRLRKKGLSYNEIKANINVSKSTLSLWLKNIPLLPAHKKRLYTKQIAILSRGASSQKERRARQVEQIIQEAGREIMLPISKETYRLMGAALYWAEGSKTKMFNITNSDPHFILFIVRWIESIFSIPPARLKARLNIYPQQNEIKIKKFWSDLTGIPLNNFGKSYVKPPSKGYKRNNLYYGTMRVEVPKSVDMRYRVFGWIKATLKDIEPKTALIQKKWQSLAKTERPINL